MIQITDRVIFVLIPIAPGKQPVQEACDFPFSVVKKATGKKSTRSGSWTCKKRKHGLEEANITGRSWNHTLQHHAQDPTVLALNGSLLRVFLASVWVATHFPLQVKAQGSWLIVLRNIHWRPRRVCCKPQKNLFVFWKKCQRRWQKTTSRDISNGIKAREREISRIFVVDSQVQGPNIYSVLPSRSKALEVLSPLHLGEVPRTWSL